MIVHFFHIQKNEPKKTRLNQVLLKISLAAALTKGKVLLNQYVKHIRRVKIHKFC